MDELWDDYFNYLLWRGCLERFTKYGKLFEILHNIEFRWVLNRDDNREADGIELRDDYDTPPDFRGSFLESNFMNHWCSVFEMLIALSIRVDNEIIGDPNEERPEVFFMEMIKNLGLDKFIGDRFDKRDVIKIVDKWLNREFRKNGIGSPFPVKKDARDQRTLEIWDQMNSYINENYC